MSEAGRHRETLRALGSDLVVSVVQTDDVELRQHFAEPLLARASSWPSAGERHANLTTTRNRRRRRALRATRPMIVLSANGCTATTQPRSNPETDQNCGCDMRSHVVSGDVEEVD